MQMTPNEWDRAKELFEAALELDPSLRGSFLAENCHEESLQQEVEKLLMNFQAAGNFLDSPAMSSGIPESIGLAEIQIREVARADLPSGQDPPTAKSAEVEDPMVGRRLGAYKLVRRVGEGGMAAVFQAVRADDEYQKEVAVKLVLPGLDSQDVLNRFRNERQTLAGLEHPNIVRLLDGGSAPEGLPFLVMEYVEGSPIDEYCDRHSLSVDERLRLFGEVCDAVQFAHQKLVIHRDLKPTNILVMADGTPKLLDFGIAKVLNPERSTYGWLATQTGLRCMTPAYASPEQTQGKSVSPQTDVYSLGVVLYELLTGHRPYRLTQHSPAEIERAICEQEPETPSTAINRVENDTSSDGKPITRTPELVSLTREGQPDKLRRRLRGDLDNIVLKALQKEPQQRYSSVAEFFQDIDRHLQHQQIKARPSTFAYRASKFAQRHKTEVGAAFAVLVVVAAAVSFAFNAAGIRNRFVIGSSDSKIQSLAVIPLLNISGDPTQEYFSDGLTDGLIADLAKIGSLKVISRTSSMQYKDAKKTPPEIARELNVDGIIEGTVQRSGDRVRITAQLIHGPSDRHLWANTYEGNFRDIFALERSVTQDIARQVQARLATNSQIPPSGPRQTNPTALEAYLQGSYHLSKYGRGSGVEELRKAAEYFQRAIDSDPNFVLAFIGLANAYDDLPVSSREDREIEKKASERALSIDPNSSEAWLTVASFQGGDFDWTRADRAEQAYRHAIALNSNSAVAHDQFCAFLGETGRLDEALAECQVAQELDPNNDHLGKILYWRGDYEHAVDTTAMMIARHPDDGALHLQLFDCYVKKHNYKEAVEELERTVTLYGLTEVAGKAHHAFASGGFRAAMLQSAKETEHLQANGRFYAPVNLADFYAILGDNERALYWLEQAYVHREMIGTGEPATYIGVDPMLSSLHSDPRFADLLRRIGLPPSDVFHAAAPQIQSLAVLPLTNLSGDTAQEYFSEGMTDALIADLAQIGSLKVISRTSSMQYKRTKKSLPEIARELNVDGIIEGTVQRSGDRVRITAQLIRAATDKHLWANSYERDVRDVFVLEREVAEDVARQVHAEGTTEKQPQLAQPRPVTAAVLDAFLQGNSHLHRFGRGFGDDELRLASEYFRQAIDAEPGFARAYVGMSKAHRTMQSSSEDVEIARKAAERAVELDPNLAEAWAALADIRCDFWDWSEAEQDYRRALSLNPNDGVAHEHLGWLLDALGRLDEGWKEAQIAQQLDPHEEHLEPALDNRHEYDQIIQHITTMLQADPGNGTLHHMLYEGYVGKGMYKEAVEQLAQAVELFGNPETAAKLRETFAVSGYKGAMRAYAEGLERMHVTKQVFAPINLAGAYAAAGDKDRAFYWLEQGYKDRGHAIFAISMIFLNTDPGLDPLRSDPRYKDLLRRVRLPELQLTDLRASGTTR